MNKTELIKQNKESFDMNIIEMPEVLDELSMLELKGGINEDDKEPNCCTLNFACNHRGANK